ncbi:MAG TPA: mannose-1-phosphate guanylyltransferase/mannose-6-phosphate isomerase [Burkholderiaceae bacterium]
MQIHPVILAGGSGTRLWPLSRESTPKQLLPLLSERTMLQQTVERARMVEEGAAPIVVCGTEHRFLVAEQLREIGVTPLAILLEPCGRNTAPAAAVAAMSLLAKDPEAVMLLMPADHAIADEAAFRQAVQRGLPCAAAGRLVTFGVVPESAHTGYGYIRQGAPVPDMPGCFAIDRFVEKPDAATAQALVATNDYCWNSGMFLFRAADYLAKLERARPAIARQCERAFRDAYRDLDFERLDEVPFQECPAESIDCAVMEGGRDGVVVPVEMGWSDVGSWPALFALLSPDEDGNVLRGDVYVDEVKTSMVRADGRYVAVIGVEDLIVVETKDAVLVAHKDSAQDVRQVVDDLKKRSRREHVDHTTVFRPWGHYEGLDSGNRFQVKRIMVKPGGKLSLQMHHHRAEHWVVVAGTARVTRGDNVTLLTENESTYIPIGTPHRLENVGKVPLHLIEVQSGSYLGEDDIVRLDDIYHRC